MSCFSVSLAAHGENCPARALVGTESEDPILLGKFQTWLEVETSRTATAVEESTQTHQGHATESTPCELVSFAYSHLGREELARVIFARVVKKFEKLGTNLNTHWHHIDAH
jgi:hypothetical protein